MQRFPHKTGAPHRTEPVFPWVVTNVSNTRETGCPDLCLRSTVDVAALLSQSSWRTTTPRFVPRTRQCKPIEGSSFCNRHFDILGHMKINHAVGALGTLAQETRLSIFRLLVEAGPTGLAAGKIAASLGVLPATLSFHLAQLAHAGLVRSRQDGRFVIYAADFPAMTALLEYLTEDCCGGTVRCSIPACAPESVRERRTRKSDVAV